MISYERTNQVYVLPHSDREICPLKIPFSGSSIPAVREKRCEGVRENIFVNMKCWTLKRGGCTIPLYQSERCVALYRTTRELTKDRTCAMLGSSDRGTLHFALLGPPQVYHGGQLLVFPSRKALALLLYLAVEEGKHSRKMLSELFWPESDAAHARSALRTTVLELRDVLMKDASRRREQGRSHPASAY